jgi:hypothetical protein
MRKAVLAVAVVGLALVGAAEAAPPPCYTVGDIEADQAIVFQTELMVAAEACRDPAYVQFLHRNKDAVIAYQHRMIDFFRRSGERRAEAAFDSYITRLANQTTIRNSQFSTQVVCDQGVPLLTVAKSLNSRSFRDYAAEKALNNATKYRRCEEREAAR